jgi:hypothetical protein
VTGLNGERENLFSTLCFANGNCSEPVLNSYMKKKNILPIILAVALSLLITACSSETEKLAVSD